MFFALSHFHNFVVTHGHIPAIFNFHNLILSELSHSQSPQHSKTYLQCLETKMETHLYYGKVKETYFTPVKNAKMLSSLETKSCLKEKIELQTSIFF